MEGDIPLDIHWQRKEIKVDIPLDIYEQLKEIEGYIFSNIPLDIH